MEAALEDASEFFGDDFREVFAAAPFEDVDDIDRLVEVGGDGDGEPVELVSVVVRVAICLEHFFGCVNVEEALLRAPFDDVLIGHNCCWLSPDIALADARACAVGMPLLRAGFCRW